MKKRGLKALTALTIAALLTAFPSAAIRSYAKDECEAASVAPDVNVSSRLLEVLFGKRTDTDKNTEANEILLCPGGDVFGAKIKEGRITVMQSSRVGSIKAGDVLISVNGRAVSTIDDLKDAVALCGGRALELTFSRDNEQYSVQLTPTKENDTYKLGLSLRDSTAGIGTVTYIEPKTGAFAGLGHGICDAESGKLSELSAGSITGVILGGVKRGEAGKPGELCGVLTSEIKGELYSNTDCGVFGILDGASPYSKALRIGKKSSVHEGDATIISTVKNGKRCEFSVKLFDVDQSSDGTKSFKIKVTDPALISLTGGIVRGMSGSPIIQDGKLIGAVTHVMIADPTEGYGIFIENMLEASAKDIDKAA